MDSRAREFSQSQVELITNPSAKYDAAYGAVINIITRKVQTEGQVLGRPFSRDGGWLGLKSHQVFRLSPT